MLQQDSALADLFVDGLKDIYSAEKQILKALPKLARAAQSDELRQAFQTHRDETEGQVERLEQVFEMVRSRPGGMMCEAMEAIIQEGSEMMEEFKESDALDTALISSAATVEHYEIGRYTTLARLARDLDLEDAAELLEENLREEEATEQKLGGLAESEGKSTMKGAQQKASAGAEGKGAGSPKARAGSAPTSGAAKGRNASVTSIRQSGMAKTAATSSGGSNASKAGGAQSTTGSSTTPGGTPGGSAGSAPRTSTGQSATPTSSGAQAKKA